MPFILRSFSFAGALAATTTAQWAYFPAQTSAPAPVNLSMAPLVVRLTNSAILPNAKEPQVAVGAQGRVVVTFGAGDAVYCAASSDSGKTFAPPVLVASSPTGHLSLGMRRGPRIALADGGKTVVITATYGREGKGQDGELLAWRSVNGARTWGKPIAISDVPGAAREGLHALAASPDGKTLACAWLDLRGPEGSGTRIYSSVSRNSGATWEPNRLAYQSPDKSVCECCHPSLVWDASGKLWLLFRNSVGGNRDMYLTSATDRGKTWQQPAQKLGGGTWKLNACPMDGGGLAVSPDGKTVQTVWRRDNDVFICTPGQPERLIGRGQQGWAAQTKNGAAFTYLAGGRPGSLRVALPGAPEPVTLAAKANDPVIAAAPDGGPLVAAWTQTEPGSGKTVVCASVLPLGGGVN